MMSETFGRMLKRRRKDAGLSQRELAQHAGLHYTYLSKIEHDKQPPPSLKAIKRLAAALCADAEDLASFCEPSKRYMARLDALSEEIGDLHQTINQYKVEVAYWRDRALKAEQGAV